MTKSYAFWQSKYTASRGGPAVGLTETSKQRKQMADKNQNFISESANSISFDPSSQKSVGNIPFRAVNNNALPTAGTRKEGLYTKKDGGGHPRNANFVKEKSIEDKSSIWNNNDVSNTESSSKKLAPIVGWQNGSPTVFPSSPVKTSASDAERGSSTSKSSGICQDSGNTEDISSLADEGMFPSTLALTIDRSVESLEPDKETPFSSLELGKARDLSPADDSDNNRMTMLSPETDCTDEPVPPPCGFDYLTSPNLTVGQSPTAQSPDDNSNVKTHGEKTQGILVRRKHSEPEATITANPGYLDYDPRDMDSIDGSESLLEIYDDVDDIRKSKVPDGGWGWVVVFASLLISMVADGVSFSFGLLYIEFLNEFEASRSKTAWIGSLFMAVPLLTGPIMSALVDRYGCRNMTILGGFIAGTGFVLSSFSRSIEVMYLTFGVFAGVGLGLCYVTAVVSIAYWFDKKRTLAVGLGACGTGVGTFVYAPMTTFFIREYGWRGTTLLLAGTFFNLIVCGTVMRDPDWWVEEQQKQQAMHGSPRKSMGRSTIGGSMGSPSDEFPGVEELRKLLKDGKAPEYLLQSFSTSTEAQPNARGGNFRSVVNLPTFVRQSEKVGDDLTFRSEFRIPVTLLEFVSGAS